MGIDCMRVIIRGGGLSEAERDSLEFRVRLGLSRFGPRQVRVGLDRRTEAARAVGVDPTDHSCRIVVEWVGQPSLTVEESDWSWPEAVTRALDRTLRLLERQREWKRGWGTASGRRSGRGSASSVRQG
ncbi:MAG: hypothetical protein KatS3mg108_2904 [Isosphaeraceae bacterium]|jgi:hypothetical protein|nr:MAG: hypothetical protein KatS3mg108_2904 [Isosphaeraceae bacterium]